MLGLPRLWYDRPVRTQLLFAVGAINVVAALVAGAVSVLNTRTATRVEIEASLEVAQRFVEATVKDLQAQGRLNQLQDQLPLELKHLRHVRILMMDSLGQLIVLSPQPDARKDDAGLSQAPDWFVSLVRPKLVGRAVRVVTAAHISPMVIVGEPADEIAEHWQNFRSLLWVWLALEVLILAVLYVVLGRVLDPLQNLSRGMIHLEDGNYATRLKAPKVKELAVLTSRFNTLAEALDTARGENGRLYRQLISVQEEERREIANELHDEAGPCLFGITANASSIKNITDQLKDRRTAEISARVGEILSITERMKLMNRALLKKLKPGSHGLIALTELLTELIKGFERQHPDTRIVAEFGKLAESYGEAIDLTLYRCIQEGITNGIRHGNAANLTIRLVEEHGSPKQRDRQQAIALSLMIRDDGKGMVPATPKGFGLSSMTERARSLGGACAIEGEPERGTTLRIDIPVQEETSVRARRKELVRDTA
jgi:two-component system sensor histidine kinase UhpB